jgi:hydrogenase/urease accessory protein HupE
MTPLAIRSRLLTLLLCTLCTLCMAGTAGTARAHDLDSASLTLTEVEPGRFLVHFRAASASLQQETALPAVFPEPCRVNGAYLECGPSGLVGPIDFPWLEGTLTRLIIEIDWQNGRHLLRMVTASAPRLTVYGVQLSGARSVVPVAIDFTRLGVEHIATGFDHVLFVIALVILVRQRRALLATITAFTAAHSLTLACTALGLLRIPVAPIEATIALSIVFVCAECLRPGDSLTRRAPWLVAFSFGLLHGLGFASALLEIGLPEGHLPAALFCFNLGVELGQLTVIGLALLVRALFAHAQLQRAWQRRALVYAMGGVAAFWCLDRVVAVFRS